MEINGCNIQVLLQAAEFLERREREAEHGYASVPPFYSKGASDKRGKQKGKKSDADSTRSVHNELEKHRRAQLRQCLEQLKQQKLQEQDERAERLKDRLRWEQRGLRMRLEQLQGSERIRNDSLGSAMSSERSDSDRGTATNTHTHTHTSFAQR
ncbi:hypothetical protein JZ751_023873 [Albula glossodonta]|uniref:Max dimerization protein 3 n=1 Tax=Albula glossodonta TaxID=121402 RepID=A0A8T2NSJ3_9TELE|nr:hypothetical protein JZ751_023873 [Albula glossodonta]